ncbi:hypothetical protein HK105_209032 [Polyrhizophydium stewartii]|uniref:Uncharacterized protein n=1 Tax=Polyrhizophydium stewartii TaxID=2732419 RepID=A0ABR4MW67_9FUNG|nr:hypothetical protein HK105_005991 [Polyrhizophydium stewartii]
MDQAKLAAALAAASSARRPAEGVHLLQDVPGGPDAVAAVDGGNALAIRCPSCRSLVLRPGAAVKSLEHTALALPSISRADGGAATPAPFVWSVADMMRFENIGFSKPLPGDSLGGDAGLQIERYLACADCDLGPLGCSGHLAAGGGAAKTLLIFGDRVAYEAART